MDEGKERMQGDEKGAEKSCVPVRGSRQNFPKTLRGSFEMRYIGRTGLQHRLFTQIEGLLRYSFHTKPLRAEQNRDKLYLSSSEAVGSMQQTAKIVIAKRMEQERRGAC